MIDACYSLPNPESAEAVIAELADAFGEIRQTPATTDVEVMDSFDWRLLKKGWLLLKTDRQYTIVDESSGQPVHTVTVAENHPLRFHGEFPQSNVTAALEKVLDMRALLRMGGVHCQSVGYDLLNNDRKTVARVSMETYSMNECAQTVGVCRVRPVRGYTKAESLVRDVLQRLALPPLDRSPIVTLLTRCDLSPGSYSSKISVVLQPEMPVAKAVQGIMQDLVAVMHANLPGIKADIDSEFLHDFRVSVRRARSLLGQLKGFLDAETAAHLQRKLRTMGAATGDVRDLDVYLLKKTSYSQMVPDFLKPGIARLFQTIQRKRRYAKDKMVKAMDSTDFNSALAELDTFARAEQSAPADAPSGNPPIGEVAKTVIFKRYRRIIKQGGRISDATPDEQLHRLRIDCKKLRYLLEFFSSLFPENQMQKLIKQLKQLQENLGDFNDLSVQQTFLIDYLQTIKPQSAQAVMGAAATGGLITRLALSHQQVRSKFLSVFEKFDSPANRRRFETLFK